MREPVSRRFWQHHYNFTQPPNPFIIFALTVPCAAQGTDSHIIIEYTAIGRFNKVKPVSNNAFLRHEGSLTGQKQITLRYHL